MRKLIVLAVAAALCAALAATAIAATKTVRVGDNWFVRPSGVPTVTVRKNDTVRFSWVGKKPHNVRVVRGPRKFSSRVQVKGTYSKRVTRRGTYILVCSIHGRRDQSMKLVVR